MMNIKGISKEAVVYSKKQCSGQHLNGAFSIHKPSVSCYMTLLHDKCHWSEVECMSVITSEVYNEI